MAYSPSQLERYSFQWSQARLVIAAVALFIGGIPPALYFNPISGLYSLISSLLKIAWLVSGIASVYLLYRWNGHRKLFGGKNRQDIVTFFVSVVSGINLGLVGLLGTNIGMSIASSRLIFALVGVIYLASAYHLHKRWKASGEKLF